MSELGELRSRMSAFESRLEELKGGVDYIMTEQRRQEHDIIKNTSLYVNLDRDVAALQHQRNSDMRVLDALRRTQVEQGEVLQAHTKTLEEHGRMLGILVAGQVEHGQILTEHGQILTEHSARLAALDGKVDALDSRVAALDGKVAALDGKIAALDGKVDTLDSKVGHLATAVDAIVRHFGITLPTPPPSVPAQPAPSDEPSARTDAD